MSEQLRHIPEPKETVRSVESFAGQAEYIDLMPEGEVKEGSLPVLVAGGWSEGRGALADTGKELLSHDYRTLLVDHARYGKPEVDGWDEFDVEIHHKANTLLEVMDDAEIDSADVIAHSEGSLNAVLAALQQPERFRSLTLVAPAGMIGKDSLLELAKRFVPKVARSVTKDALANPRASAALNLGGQAYIAKNPRKAYREVDAIANTTIDEALGYLRENGVKIGLLQSNADPVFPAERIERNVKLDGEFQNVDSYSSVIAKDAGHDDLLIHPERSTKAAIGIIEDLNRAV